VLQFMYGDIADVTTPNNLTVVVSMKSPWVAFPAWLWNIGRVGIAAPAQLDAGEACKTKLIGSGPFKVTSFDPSTGDVSTKKNASYWRAGYPLLDHLNFKIVPGTDNRLNGLQGGQLDIMSDSSGATFDTVKSLPGITYQLAPAGRRALLADPDLLAIDPEVQRIADRRHVERLAASLPASGRPVVHPGSRSEDRRTQTPRRAAV